MGFIVEKTKKTADGGIDINAYSEEPIYSGRYIVQCKRQSSPIPETTTRDLYGVMTSENANKGILITNSTFSPPSQKFAAGRPIELINGDKLVELFFKYYEIATQKKQDKINIYDGMLCDAVIKVISGIERKYKTAKEGYAFKEVKKQMILPKYFEILDHKGRELKHFINALMKFNAGFGSYENGDIDEMSEITAEVREFRDNLKECLGQFFNSWKRYYQIHYPTSCYTLHNIWIQAYDKVFRSLFM